MKINFRRLILILITVVLFSSTIEAKNLTVNFSNTPLEKVMAEIKKQSGYEFVYQKNLVDGNEPVTMNLKNVSIEQILNRLFVDSDIAYEIIDKTIVLSKAPDNSPFFKRQVTGIVTDSEDEPLVGVSVFVEGTTTGASTDIDGQFTIMVEKGKSTLRFSYVGMKTRTVKISPKEKYVMVKMEEEPQMMSEVVVTGYQNLKRENATGSYQTISSADMARRYTGDITSNLEGQVPGLVTYDNGNGKEISIRGTGSFQANTSPLVVVDGLPIEGGIESVNPYEIDNITVLKDAAAAAIYGARASNGVIVITTKRAREDKLQVEFNADITISEKNDYSYMGWATPAEMIELEGYNFNYINSLADRTPYNTLLNYHKSGRDNSISPATLLMLRKSLGEIDENTLQSSLRALAANDYRKEWQDAMERVGVRQQYNLAIRYNGKVMSNSLVLNYENDNMGTVGSSDNSFMLNYRGGIKIGRILDVAIGLNIVSQRYKSYLFDGEWGAITSFSPYLSMYNPDGGLAAMTATYTLDDAAYSNPVYGLKKASYNHMEEIGLNTLINRRTNIRPWINAMVHILDGWSASAMFQYEDIYFKSDELWGKDSYSMRTLYNNYTVFDRGTGKVTHYIPEGGKLNSATSEGSFYTFRVQTDYNNTIAEKHDISAAIGFEYREQREKTYANILMGYDDQTQTNANYMMNWGLIKDMEGSSGVLGVNYPMYGAPESTSFGTSHILHRFYSIYGVANYVYDSRYALALSCRLDKTDLFGADPKFRGRPLWSVGASWNLQNEAFMRDYTWLDVLKLRVSYGLTGNIAQNISSMLTASIGINEIYGNKFATLNTPPNDQLRWEKTATWNVGADFSFFGRLSGSLDFYRKNSSDLLSVTDLDPTTGWSQLTINNGKMVNTGFELQLNSPVIIATSPSHFGLNLSFNLAYNHNKVTKVDHQPTSGLEALSSNTLHKGYPVNSLFSYDFAGMVTEGNMQYYSWRDHQGKVQTANIDTDFFTPEDIVYCGSLDPKVVGSFMPRFSWQRFELAVMLSWYTGHVMRANTDMYTSEGSVYGYTGLAELEAIPSSYLNYWRTGETTKYPANGYLGGTNVIGYGQYMNANVVPADFMKIRNVVLTYEFAPSICKKLRLEELQLRFQVNNLCTWARNNLGIDPEANNPIAGTKSLKVPRSYTFSLYFSF
ncbi:MAG: SusC/RagA family TonB-linked outer membrane protein [Muribaculaceae bacterium]|nr:SusC/RagA family TonB-linked outer membrane protein [Muribaculaceae bacterium]